MRESKLEEIRNKIEKLLLERKKYNERNKKIQELEQDEKVKKYIELTNQQNNASKIIKESETKDDNNSYIKYIVDQVFADGIEKMPLEETNGIYIYQGIRKMADRVYYKYHNLEKQMPTFILEEQNEKFVKNTIIIDGVLSNNTPENQQRFYSEIQSDFFRVMYNDGQEAAKQYIKTIHSSIIKK